MTTSRIEVYPVVWTEDPQPHPYPRGEARAYIEDAGIVYYRCPECVCHIWVAHDGVSLELSIRVKNRQFHSLSPRLMVKAAREGLVVSRGAPIEPPIDCHNGAD